MARPRKAPADLHTHTLRFTVPTADYVRIQKSAAQAGLTVSQYLRESERSTQIVVSQVRTLDPDLFDQIRRIGVNLNQAVKFLHAKGSPQPELIAAAQAVERFLRDNLDGAESRR